jgi:hypothetical protein
LIKTKWHRCVDISENGFVLNLPLFEYGKQARDGSEGQINWIGLKEIRFKEFTFGHHLTLLINQCLK